MHYHTITTRALQECWITTAGKTPEATMYAQIHQEIERQTRRGEQPRFIKMGKGMISLTRWTPSGLPLQIQEQNRMVKQALGQRIHDMTAGDFEALTAKLLTAIGFQDVVVTQLSGDNGIDVRGTLVVGDVIRTRMAVQVKKWKRNVQSPVVQQVRGSLGTHEQGLIITTSDFSKGAVEEAARATAVPVGLMNGRQLIELLVEYGIGVQRTPYELLALSADDAEDE
jgi:restriction system protein